MNKRSIFGRAVYLLLFSILIQACGQEKSVQPPEEQFVINSPSNFGEVPFPESNPFTSEKIELGRTLFYDPILSGNNQISCATCHDQSVAFSDGLLKSNLGISGNILKRHTPALINLAWMDGLFWDGGVKNIEALALAPLEHPDEMSQDLGELIRELKNDSYYSERFSIAFQSEDIKLEFVLESLAQFQRTLISANSKYDSYIRNEGAELNDQEIRGLSLFEKNCQSCHSGQLFTDNKYHNNGLDDEWNDISDDYILTGRFRITFDSSDLGKFKTPTLRNAAFTAPYMHDGRFEDLKEVLDHYSSGVKNSESLDFLLRGNNDLGIDMNEAEKEDLIAFINTLRDYEFISNPKYGAPD